MKLYIYDHCPYCTKARMIFGFKKISIQVAVLTDDDNKTPISKIGVKKVPFLEFEENQFMAESLDIISYIDQRYPPNIISWDEDKDLSSWFNEEGSLYYRLAMPRWAQSSLEEFKTQSSRDHFKNRLESKVGPFSELLKNTEELKADMEKLLLKLESLFQSDNYFKKEGLSINDFHLFALLRSLTIVKDFKFPNKIESYVNKISKESQVPLHTNLSL